MRFLGNRVARAVHELFTEPGFSDDPAAHVVHLPSVARLPFREAVLHERHRGIARIADDRPDFPVARRWDGADEADPGDVVIDRAGDVQLGPHIDQERVTLLDRPAELRGEIEVGIGRVLVGAHHGGIVCREVLLVEAAHDELLDAVLGHLGSGEDRRPDGLKSFGANAVHNSGSLLVRAIPFFRDDRHERLQEVGRGDDLVPEPLDELDGAGIHDGDIRHVVLRRVLHGKGFAGAERFAQGGMKLFPGKVDHRGAGQRVELVLLHGRNQFLRVAAGGDIIEPAPGVHLVEVQTENFVAEEVPVAEVAEQPPVDAFLAQKGLDRVEVHGGDPTKRMREGNWKPRDCKDSTWGNEIPSTQDIFRAGECKTGKLRANGRGALRVDYCTLKILTLGDRSLRQPPG